MIAVSGLAKAYGRQTLFESVSLQFNAGERYGVVGANGSGKSTFLRLLAGEEIASEGAVSIPKRARVGVLRQDHFRYEGVPIVHVVMMGHQLLWPAIQEKEALLERPDFDAERYAELEDVILAHDGYALESRAAEILEGLGIPSHRHHHPLSTLSGGFKLRVLLAQVLASSPDVLLLDEPTNHLDILSIRWFEKFLGEFPGCALVVSHDHRFLDNVSTYIADVDYETILLYRGNYSDFVAAKAAERERKEAEIAKQERQIADHKEFVDRFRAKATKARQAQSKLKLIDRIEIVRLPRSSRRYPVFRLGQVRPSGKEVLRASAIAKAYGAEQVLDGVELEVRRGDRLAILGPNGIGKSTLLKILVGAVEADGGSIEWGYETHPGYFAQDHREQLAEPRRTVEEWLWDFCPGEPVGFVRGQLGMVLFSGDEVKKRVGNLSGGEAARLLFARMAVEKPNVLLLDEPTNHLDLEAIEALAQGLEQHPGTLVFVSHDRWFVSRLANRILEITPHGLNDFHGTYEEYLERLGDDHLDAAAVLARARKERQRKPSASGEGAARTDGAERGGRAADGGGAARRERGAGGTRRRDVGGDGANSRPTIEERRDLLRHQDKIQNVLEKAEARVHEINEQFADPGFFGAASREKVRQLEHEQKRLKAEIDGLMTEWQQVDEALGRLAEESSPA
ncbi:MAG TPA: ATP-binding cassette domain-containing protein [Thermoanaerobaculia bacterium]|nr:ATP-binding cassette domain-containing protein [Thermoanaerobaculia bacterium]